MLMQQMRTSSCFKFILFIYLFSSRDPLFYSVLVNLQFLGRDFMLVSTGTSEYNLSKEDVGRRLAFVYIPINFEGLLLLTFTIVGRCLL